MQLNNKSWCGSTDKPPIRSALMMATCTVLSGSLTSVSVAEQVDTVPSKVGLSTFYYAEENRVSVNTTHVSIENELDDEAVFRANFIYDTITGASPNGRVITSGPVSNGSIPFTSASGFTLSVNDSGSAGKKWLTEFSDKRAAVDLSLERLLSRVITGTLEGSFSSENDFTSYGAAATLRRDLNQRNTTVTGGLSILKETVSPASGTPLGLAISNCNTSAAAIAARPAWANCNITTPRFGNGQKRVFDGFVGVTQVLNQRTITQLNFSHGVSLGYLTDPYKLISVVDETLDSEEAIILYEKRPDRRVRNSLYWKVISQLNPKEVVDFSYRYFWDDWGVASHTFDYKYRYDYAPKSYLQPHVRVNIQSRADFFMHAIDSSESSLPQYASADYRLGKLSTYSLGIKYGKELSKNGSFTIRAEYIQQRYADLQLPNMSALVYQGTFTFKF